MPGISRDARPRFSSMLKNSASLFTDSKFRRAAWLTVGILWTVALLNYLDRNVIATMRSSIVADIPMTDAQFGLLTSVFLWVYGICSPLGGYLADKLGRKWIIFGSLLVWSSVTWLTGHVHSFNQLLVARSLMGISEACYIPAALALITDYHRGSTRSLATGLHNSGIYAGAALGGIGGVIAEYFGWRIGFTLFGAFGVLYALVVLVFLRDANVQRDVSEAPKAPINILATGKSLFREWPFWALLILNAFVGIANWLVYTWMPTFLQEGFGLGQGEAGLTATVYLQVASFIAILAGGVWADRWSVSNPRARTYVTAIGFAVAAPALFITGGSSFLPIAIFGLIFYGLGRGFYDANLMPILRQVIDERYSATGYGILNFVGCMVGGVMTYAGGALRDAHVPLGITIQGAAIGIVVTSLMLFFLRRRPRRDSDAIG